MSQYLIAGLGNPGADYANTRHNIGWMAVDAFAHRHQATWKEDKTRKAITAKLNLAGETVWLAKPLTYMNDSGMALGRLLRYYKITPSQLVVCFDEINLPVGRMKFALQGSAGGHNGLSSVLQHCGNDFIRLRLGIGNRPHPEMDLKQWVLGRFDSETFQEIQQFLPRVCDAFDSLLDIGLDMTMNRFNQKNLPQSQ